MDNHFDFNITGYLKKCMKCGQHFVCDTNTSTMMCTECRINNNDITKETMGCKMYKKGDVLYLNKEIKANFMPQKIKLIEINIDTWMVEYEYYEGKSRYRHMHQDIVSDFYHHVEKNETTSSQTIEDRLDELEKKVNKLIDVLTQPFCSSLKHDKKI